jgi:hypothetical protein
MYTDTLMRMMRRHCSHQYKTVDQNKSLYEKTQYKSFAEQIKEVAPKEVKPIIPSAPMTQGELPFFNQVFLVVFFVLFLGVGLGSGTAFGRPLFPPSRMASRSASLYMPADPINRDAFRPYLWSLLFAASDVMPSSWAISKTVNSLIPFNLHHNPYTNQVENEEMSKHLDIITNRPR